MRERERERERVGVYRGYRGPCRGSGDAGVRVGRGGPGRGKGMCTSRRSRRRRRRDRSCLPPTLAKRRRTAGLAAAAPRLPSSYDSRSAAMILEIHPDFNLRARKKVKQRYVYLSPEVVGSNELGGGVTFGFQDEESSCVDFLRTHSSFQDWN